jgi:hypothetical protein
MAHFARIIDGTVREVIVINNVELDDGGIESEAKGIAFCQSLFGADTVWVQTSYTGSPVGGPPKTDRGKYAGIGDRWDGSLFIAPTQP